jgi:hypothetical protein
MSGTIANPGTAQPEPASALMVERITNYDDGARSAQPQTHTQLYPLNQLGRSAAEVLKPGDWNFP